MTSTKADRYRRVSGRTGIICSSCIVVSALAFGSIWIIPDSSPEWLHRLFGVLIFGGYAGALGCGIICIMAAIFGRKEPTSQIDAKHEDTAA